MYNEAEIKFLMTASHQVENASGNRMLRDTVDLRAIGCPERMFNRLLEQRARKAGSRFAEFRSQNQLTVPTVKSLEMELASAKLF